MIVLENIERDPITTASWRVNPNASATVTPAAAKTRGAPQGDYRRLAHHPRELLGVQVQTEQIQQEDDSDFADPLCDGRVLDQADSPRTDQHPECDVGDQHGLAREQGQPGDNRAPGEDQEDREENGLAVHPSSESFRLMGGTAPLRRRAVSGTPAP